MQYPLLWHRHLFSFCAYRFGGLLVAIITLVWSAQAGFYLEFAVNNGMRLNLSYLLTTLYQLPNIAFIFMPFITLLATVTSAYSLRRNGTITTLESFGIGRGRIFAPLRLSAVILFAVHAWISWFFLPVAEEKIKATQLINSRDYLQQTMTKKRGINIDNKIILHFIRCTTATAPAPTTTDTAAATNATPNHDSFSYLLEDITVLDMRDPKITTEIIAAEAWLHFEPSLPQVQTKPLDTASKTELPPIAANVQQRLSVKMRNGQIFHVDQNNNRWTASFAHHTTSINLPEVQPPIINKHFYEKLSTMLGKITAAQHGTNQITPFSSIIGDMTLNKTKISLAHRLIWPFYSLILVEVFLSMWQRIKFTRGRHNPGLLAAISLSFAIIPLYFAAQAVAKNHSSPLIINFILQICSLIIIAIYNRIISGKSVYRLLKKKSQCLPLRI